jgi:hypothetical protein
MTDAWFFAAQVFAVLAAVTFNVFGPCAAVYPALAALIFALSGVGFHIADAIRESRKAGDER